MNGAALSANGAPSVPDTIQASSRRRIHAAVRDADPEKHRLPVRQLPTGAIAADVRRNYEERFGNPPEKLGRWYRDDDWRRTSFLLQLARPGVSVPDVGAGAGRFANMLAASGNGQTVTALDRVRFEKQSEFYPDRSRRDAGIVELAFNDDGFDVVACMDVLEHVPDDVLAPGIAELRRVCRGQLIMSVPNEEAEPLSKGPMRRFEAADVRELVPDAGITMLDRPRMPWLIIEERLDGTEFAEPLTLDDLPSVRVEKWARSVARRARRGLLSRRRSA